MEERRYSQRQGIQRHPVTGARDCLLGTISFRNLEWIEHTAQILDQSVVGLGVETDQPIEPGLIWFKECVYGQRCGFVVWNKEMNGRYRSGIKFLALTREEEEYLRLQISQVQPHELFPDPGHLLARMMDGIRKDLEVNVNPPA